LLFSLLLLLLLLLVVVAVVIIFMFVVSIHASFLASHVLAISQ
jgi:hypothetical protein